MSATGFKGIDVRQTGTALIFEAFVQDSAGALVTSAGGTFKLYEMQSDATLKTYDFNDNTFKTATVTTLTLSATHRTANNGAVNTGLYTAVLSTLTGFTVGATYRVHFNHASESPTDQMRIFQYGSDEGDLVVTANGTGVGELNTDLKMANGTAVTLDSNNALNVSTKYVGGTLQTAKDLGAINVTTLNTLSGHDPGTTIGTSTLTQTQVTGGAYALNSASFAFNAATDFTTAMKANFPAHFANLVIDSDLGNSQYLLRVWDESGNYIMSKDQYLDLTNGTDKVTLAAAQAAYAPAKAGDAMALTAAYDAAKTAASATNLASAKTAIDTINTNTAPLATMIAASKFTVAALSNAPGGGSGGTTTNVTITERDVVIR